MSLVELTAVLMLSGPVLGFLFGICSRCCCALLFEDTFTRANNTDLGSDWEEVAGDWEIVSSSLTTSDTNAIVLHAQTYDRTIEGFGFYVAEMGLYGDTPFGEPISDNSARMIFNWQDSDNYHFVELLQTRELTFGLLTSSTLSIYDRTGGVETLLHKADLYFSTGINWYLYLPGPVFICLSESILAVSAFGLQVLVVDFTPRAAATKFGFGTGANVSSLGAMFTSDVRIRPDQPAEVDLGVSPAFCTCTKLCTAGCPDGAPHRGTYSLDIPSFTCGDVLGVETVAGTYVLAPKSVDTSGSGNIPFQYFNACEWSYILPSGKSYLRLQFSLGVWTLTVFLQNLCGLHQNNGYIYKSAAQPTCKFTGTITLTKFSESAACSCSPAVPDEIELTRS